MRGGLVYHMLKYRRIKHTASRYISYMVDAEDWYFDNNECVAWDDVAGQKLNADMVVDARMEELYEYCNHQVHVEVPENECWERHGINLYR